MKRLLPVLLLLLLVANMSGHAITGVKIAAVAMACSPTDSTLAYVSTGSEHRLCSVKPAWTADTLCVDGAGIRLSRELFGSYIDWASYSDQ